MSNLLEDSQYCVQAFPLICTSVFPNIPASCTFFLQIVLCSFTLIPNFALMLYIVFPHFSNLLFVFPELCALCSKLPLICALCFQFSFQLYPFFSSIDPLLLYIVPNICFKFVPHCFHTSQTCTCCFRIFLETIHVVVKFPQIMVFKCPQNMVHFVSRFMFIFLSTLLFSFVHFVSKFSFHLYICFSNVLLMYTFQTFL